jgi:hypothetical protein
MKIYTSLDVALVDLETFRLYPNAEQFQEEFKNFAISRLVYRFYDDKSLSAALQKLKNWNIGYKKFYGLEFESDQEMESYPCVWISFSGLGDLLKKKDGTLTIDAKKMGKNTIKDDVTSNELVFTGAAKDFFKQEVPAVKFESIYDTAGKKEFFRLAGVHVLSLPFIYKYVQEIKHATGKDKTVYIANGSDERVYFSEPALQEIKENVFCFCRKFSYNGDVYPAANTHMVCTGAFAVKLKQKFGSTDQINIRAITLDTI